MINKKQCAKYISHNIISKNTIYNVPDQGRSIQMQPSQTTIVVNRRESLFVALILAPFFLFRKHRLAEITRNHYLLALIHFFAFRLLACLIFTKISPAVYIHLFGVLSHSLSVHTLQNASHYLYLLI